VSIEGGGMAQCSEHQAVFQRVEAHHKDIMELYERLRVVETDLAVEQRLHQERHTNIQDKLDELKAFVTASLGEIKGMIQVFSDAIKDQSARISEIEKEPGRRAIDQREKIALEIVKWVLFAAAGGGAFGGILSILKGAS
jgi:hypothetical protein